MRAARTQTRPTKMLGIGPWRWPQMLLKQGYVGYIVYFEWSPKVPSLVPVHKHGPYASPLMFIVAVCLLGKTKREKGGGEGMRGAGSRMCRAGNKNILVPFSYIQIISVCVCVFAFPCCCCWWSPILHG